MPHQKDQSQLEQALLNRKVPFKEGYRPADPYEPEVAESMAEVRRYSPTARLMEKEGKFHINKSDLFNKLGNSWISLISRMLLRGEGGDSFGGGGGLISLSPADKSRPDVLAHEMGHVRQADLGLPMGNNEEADYILQEYLDNKKRVGDFFDPDPVSRGRRRPQFGHSIIKLYGDEAPSWIETMTNELSKFKKPTPEDAGWQKLLFENGFDKNGYNIKPKK